MSVPLTLAGLGPALPGVLRAFRRLPVRFGRKATGLAVRGAGEGRG